MAVIERRIDDWLGIGGLDWKTMGGGGGGAGGDSTGGGLGTAIIGSLAATGAALAAGGFSGGSTGTKNPEINAEMPNKIVDQAATDSAVQETQPDPEIPDTENIPDIEDKTSENVETAIDNTDMLEMLKGLRDEQWAREDAIRAETQQREDTAFSRGIADMRRAGVNVNLVGAQPAESGGGITNATGVDLGMLETALNNEGQTLIAMLNNEFKGDENTKDRIMQGISSAISLTGQIIMAYLFKKAK